MQYGTFIRNGVSSLVGRRHSSLLETVNAVTNLAYIRQCQVRRFAGSQYSNYPSRSLAVTKDVRI
jgi:hypothetical protein